MTALTHLSWPPTRDNLAAWEAAGTLHGHIGDTGADHGPEPVDDVDGDWLCCREENIGRRR